jgi:hypothetical protein
MKTFGVPCPQCGSLEPHDLSRRVDRHHQSVVAHCNQCEAEWGTRLAGDPLKVVGDVPSGSNPLTAA